MARWEIKNVNIAGVAMAVPQHTVKTADIDLFTAEEAEVFDNTVGIKSRHIAPDTMCASDMCQAAAERLLEELGWERDSIDALVTTARRPPPVCYRPAWTFRRTVSVSIYPWAAAAACTPSTWPAAC